MARHKVEICGVNTANIQVLTNEEMIVLFEKMASGDEDAKEKLINGNLKLVLSILRKFANRTDNMDDLFQVGVIGLIKAIDNFDLSYGLKLSTYACPMILGEIRRFLRDNNSMRVSRSVRDMAYHAMQTREQLQKELGRDPTIQELSARMEQPQSVVTLALESVMEPLSLYEPVYNDGGDTLYVMDQIGENEGEESWISTILFRDTIGALSDREKKIISLRYLAGKTQVEVAREIGISQAQVSRLEKGALERIKKQI